MNSPRFFSLSNSYMLFVGSAISIWEPSNAPSATQMKNAIIRSLWKLCPPSVQRDLDIRLIFGRKPRLEWIFEELWNYIGDRLFKTMDIYDQGEPNSLHFYVAKEFIQGRILRIYTTNQDCYLEKALEKLGWHEGTDYKVVLPDEQIISNVKEEPYLIKLHGSTNRKSSIRTTLLHVGLGLSQSIFRNLIKDLNNHTFYFMGYSGLDIDIRRPILESQPHQIYWNELPNVSLSNHFISTLKQAGKNVSEDLFDISLPSNSAYSKLKKSENIDADPWKYTFNIFKNEFRITVPESAHILGRIFRLGNQRHQRYICVNFSLIHIGQVRQKWRLYYEKVEIYLFEARLLIKCLKALYYYYLGARQALVEKNLNGYAICRIGMGLSMDMMFYANFHPISIISLYWIYLPLLKKLPFNALSYQENEFLKYKTLFYVGRAFARLRNFRKAKRIFKVLVETPKGSRDILGHAARYLGAIYSLQNDYEKAEELYSTAHEEFSYREVDVEMADVERMEAKHYLKKGQIAIALQKAKAALDKYRFRQNFRGIKKAEKLVDKIGHVKKQL